MSSSALVIWDEALLAYDLGPGHPLRPVRLALTMSLAEHTGLLSRPGTRCEPPRLATQAELERVHAREYLALVQAAAADPAGPAAVLAGLGPGDTPAFPGVHAAASRVAGGSIMAAAGIWTGQVEHAVNISGGLHHAMRDQASGFCVYNDPAVSIAWLLDRGAARVAYVDCDVHHGDGVQAAFLADPRVLTISLHQSGETLFPGTGFPREIGEGPGTGYAVNVALPAHTGDAGWLRAFSGVVEPLVRAFSPDVLVSQHGADTHVLDPLAQLRCSVEGQRAAALACHELAHACARGRWVALGGGGYEPVRVVPRTWTHLLAIATGEALPADLPTPPGWRAEVAARVGMAAPQRMGDGAPASFVPWSAGPPDVADPVDQAVVATRSAVFPHHGLDPVTG